MLFPSYGDFVLPIWHVGNQLLFSARLMTLDKTCAQKINLCCAGNFDILKILIST